MLNCPLPVSDKVVLKCPIKNTWQEVKEAQVHKVMMLTLELQLSVVYRLCEENKITDQRDLCCLTVVK